VTEREYQLEQELRALANTSNGFGVPEGRLVLADFYERHGQLSRASLWRASSRSITPADQCVAPTSHRKVMVWLMRCHSWDPKTVVRVLRSTETWVGRANNEIEEKVHQAANMELFSPTLAATQRLRAAGALPLWTFGKLRSRLLDVFLPPDSWPVTRPFERMSAADRSAMAPMDEDRMAAIVKRMMDAADSANDSSNREHANE
jgi:hypothetical protein